MVIELSKLTPRSLADQLLLPSATSLLQLQPHTRNSHLMVRSTLSCSYTPTHHLHHTSLDVSILTPPLISLLHPNRLAQTQLTNPPKKSQPSPLVLSSPPLRPNQNPPVPPKHQARQRRAPRASLALLRLRRPKVRPMSPSLSSFRKTRS